ncbi:MAG: MBL fold metallo-hydrolase RNA specificity domain-containing protein [Thermoguttaceae bacterium]
MFHWDNGLKLTRPDLAIDFRRRQPRAFVSHAHADHMARHQYALCTPATAALYQLRLGKRPVRHLPYRETIEWGGVRLTTYPAGHCLGSAMLLAEDDGQSLLYSGDFQLRPSLTSEPAELVHADIFVLECTFGRPEYRFPPRDAVISQFLQLVAGTLAAGAVPMVVAYALGKAQEVTRILTDAGFPVVQHGTIWPITQVYEQLAMPLGNCRRWSGRLEPGEVAVVPPGGSVDVAGPIVRFALTGWACDPRAKYRLKVDHVLPLSDHADYDELLEAVERVGAKKVFCTHGPDSFVDSLRALGVNAWPADRPWQARLF